MLGDFVFGSMASELLSRNDEVSRRRQAYRAVDVTPPNSEDMSEIYTVLETMMDAMESMSARLKELEGKPK